MDLSEAIEIAEEYGIGSAVSAGLEERNDKPIFVAVVVADGTLKEVSVEWLDLVGSISAHPARVPVVLRSRTATARRPRRPRSSKEDGPSRMPGTASLK